MTFEMFGAGCFGAVIGFVPRLVSTFRRECLGDVTGWNERGFLDDPSSWKAGDASVVPCALPIGRIGRPTNPRSASAPGWLEGQGQ